MESRPLEADRRAYPVDRSNWHLPSIERRRSRTSARSVAVHRLARRKTCRADLQVAARIGRNVGDAQHATLQHIRPFLSLSSQAEKLRAAEWCLAGRQAIGLTGVQVPVQAKLPVVENMLYHRGVELLRRIVDEGEVEGMPCVGIGQPSFGPQVTRIARFRRSIKVLRGGNQLGKGVTTVELEVIREPLIQVQNQPVVGRSTTVLLCADRTEGRIRPAV